MYISLIQVWKHDTVARMKLAAFVVHIYAVPFVMLGEIAHIFLG